MNIHIPKIYCFISEFDKDYIKYLNKDIAIIYRNYDKNINLTELINFRNFCKKNARYFFLANHPRIAIKLNLDGVYIPAFNQNLNIVTNKRKNFLILGSAHSIPEIKIKEKQNVDCIFLSPLFLTKKSNKYLGIVNFLKLTNQTTKKIIALGGLTVNNLKQINKLKIYGYASISLFKEINIYKKK